MITFEGRWGCIGTIYCDVPKDISRKEGNIGRHYKYIVNGHNCYIYKGILRLFWKQRLVLESKEQTGGLTEWKERVVIWSDERQEDTAFIPH